MGAAFVSGCTQQQGGEIGHGTFGDELAIDFWGDALDLGQHDHSFAHVFAAHAL